GICRSGLLAALAMSTPILLSGCNGKTVQDTFAPDPKLKQPTAAEPTTNDLPADFPQYPQAKLLNTDRTDDRGIVTTWTTPDPIESVYKFYQQELTAKQWQIVTQPSDTAPQLVATQPDRSNVTIAPEPSTDKQQTGVTTYTISLLATTASPTPTPAPSSPAPSSTPTPSPKPLSNNLAPANTGEYLADLTKLGVFTSADTSATGKTPPSNRPVTRREYARWLVAAHNRINGTKPTQQLKLATSDAKPAFQDVPTTNPDFPSIQGLAEAGLIPSPLSGDATSVLFRPEAPVTREQMILWKVPLDTRQPLPAASLDAVKQTWGFQDAGKIDPKAMRAVLADFQNGDQANIKRVFGYTTLFQPKKTVTLGEVAIAIWYFGANSEGLSAREATLN
ncbi:S-layer homology domain-containing protein, partial [Chamaesiphon sp. OTE_20_metabat_361]|uniref:S-layer homology domain-containing protein n=1 Tax=Chamaesiphon sp. OTE_20_metabat_361 TaxID=2964689 RepID=UPI00286D2ED6